MQKIVVGKDITITIVRIDGNKVRLGIEAPDCVPIFREEVLTHAAERAVEHHLSAV
jgi:carbon storage regulator